MKPVFNTASGYGALHSNSTGSSNIAVGLYALFNNTTGNSNIAIGTEAGMNLTSEDNNIYLGYPGAVTESDTVRLGQDQTRAFIAGIVGTPLHKKTGRPVFITSDGQLGVKVSSARYKREIRDMGASSQGLFQPRPVTFCYKDDPEGLRQCGLIAEEVAQVYPELVTREVSGAVAGVQYDELIPLLVNEVQGQARQIAEQSRQIAELKAQNERLQAVLVQQHAAMAARLERLEEAARGQPGPSPLGIKEAPASPAA